MVQLVFELIFDLCLSVFLIAFYGISYTFRTGKPSPNDVLGVSGFPRMIIVLALVFLVFQIAGTIKKIRLAKLETPDTVQTAQTPEQQKDRFNGYGRMLLCMVVIAAYIAAMKWIGYTVSTFFFLIALTKAIGYKKHKAMIVFALVFTIVLVGIFGTLFSISLPRGFGILKELSFYIY